MIKKIAHLADIHIRKTPTRNVEYQQVFDNLYISLKEMKPDRIVIVGDLVHDYLDLQGEQLIMAYGFLRSLTTIAPVRITRGNHDCRKRNLKRVDSIEAIVKTLGDVDIIYYNKTGFEIDDNIAWAVWHHGEKNNNPWKTKEGKIILANKIVGDMTTIDLFHDPVSGCLSPSNFEMKSNSYYSVGDFKGDLTLFGDIHKWQYLDKKETKGYSSSLIEQDISEGDGAFHGYLMWDVDKRKSTPISVHNDYSHHNININPYIDFSDLDFEIEHPTKYMKIRFVWSTLPQVRSTENQRNVVEYIKRKYSDVTISHKNNFIEEEIIDINEQINLDNVVDEAVQEEIFREYLTKIGTDKQLIDDVIALDYEIFNEIDIIDEQTIEWDIIKFGGRNFMSYEKLDIDWREMDGIFQINGDNTAGKTTIMKILTYLFFGKTLETENRVKFGDRRFVNNRNGASIADAYAVLEANGEYFGVKRKTEITRKRDGTINGAPTTLNYYLLNSPDDDMNDDNSLNKLDDDNRIKTQKKIDSIIGTYENFMRIVMTTSDTLNKNLSNDMAVFIDSLLFDSGLDIFDKKLDGLKAHQKRVKEKTRVVCNVESTTNQNLKFKDESLILVDEINTLETVKLVEIQNNIKIGETYVGNLNKKLYNIDSEIYNLDVDVARNNIKDNNKNILDIRARETVLTQSVGELKDSYDNVKLDKLLVKKDSHRQIIYDKKLEIKDVERKISGWQHEVEIINGKIFILKKSGLTLKTDINNLKNSKICSQCGQVVDKIEHINHINKTVKLKEIEMYNIGDEIKRHQTSIKTDQTMLIETNDEIIVNINNEIIKINLEMESVLSEIGILINEKNDVERRNKFQDELNLIPTKVQNEELKIEILNEKINSHENSLKQIEENKKIENGIVAAKKKLTDLNEIEVDIREDIYIKKTGVGNKTISISNNNILLAEFKLQEYADSVISLYMKCVHRDGIPRQMLRNYIIPKVNETLEKILTVAQFKVWLDVDDLRPKLMYYDRPTAIIDCISSSGKERTFSSVVLKFALNQINVKAKPSIFLLDEVMGKLDENSIAEFMGILLLIKNNMKKLLVVEQRIELNGDYLIQVQLDDKGISSLTIE